MRNKLYSLHKPAVWSAIGSAMLLIVACGNFPPGPSDGSGNFDVTRSDAGNALFIQHYAKTEATDCPPNTVQKNDIVCYKTTLPENYDVPTGKKISITTFVRRSLSAERKGTIYLIDGGPGGNGLGMFAWVQQTTLARNGWDVVLLPHRGTVSSLISCPTADDANNELAKFLRLRNDIEPCVPNANNVPDDETACAKQRELEAKRETCGTELVASLGGGSAGTNSLNQYNSVNAARDIIATIPGLHRGGEVAIYGVSYGTYVAQRAAQLFPDQVHKIILDSPIGFTTVVADTSLYLQSIIEEIIDECISDDQCHKHMGFDTGKAALEAAVQNLNSGKCYFQPASSAPIHYTAWKASYLDMFIRFTANKPDMRPLVPYFVASAAHCDIARLTELDQIMKNKVNSFFPTSVPEINNGLYYTVVFSEFVNQKDKTFREHAQDVMNQLKDRAIGFSGGWAAIVVGAQGWDMVTFTTIPKSYSTYRTPTLILSAKYDTQTPRQFSDAIRDEMILQNVHVELWRASYAAHAVLPTDVNGAIYNGACGLNRVLHFLQGAPADTFNCVEAKHDWNFQDAMRAGTIQFQLGFSRSNLWE